MSKQLYNQSWMTLVFDESLTIVDIINPQHCMLLQLSEDNLTGKNVCELEKITRNPNKKSAAIISENISRAYKENINVYFEYNVVHKDKSVTNSVCYAEKGLDGLLYMNVIKIDEERIFDMREGFSNYFIDAKADDVSVGIGIKKVTDDDESSYILFNKVAQDFFESECVDKSVYWDKEENEVADERTMLTSTPLKMEKVIRDGYGNIHRWLMLTKYKIKSMVNGYYIITIMVDITKRRQNEILLEQQFMIFDSMYKNLSVGIIIYDKQGFLLSVNQKNREIMGIPENVDLSGVNLFKEPHVPEEFIRKLKEGKDIAYNLDYNFSSINGYFHTEKIGTKPLHVSISVIWNKDSINGYLLVNQDRTDLVAHEKLLEKTVAKLNTVFNSMSSGIELYDKDGLLIDCNHADLEIFGIEEKKNSSIKT